MAGDLQRRAEAARALAGIAREFPDLIRSLRDALIREAVADARVVWSPGHDPGKSRPTR